MKFNEIATSGCRVSCFGLGTVKFGRNEGVKYPSAFKLPDDKKIADLLAIAQEFGVNLVDTAPAYGSSELRLGKLLKQMRQEWVISTKVGEFFEKGLSSFDFSAAAIEKSIHESLRRLSTDYIDIVMVHSDGNDKHIITETDALETLEKMKHKGLIRCIGVSTKTVNGGILALERSDMAMVTYNLANATEKSVLDYALTSRKGIFVKKALDSGNLSLHGDQTANREADNNHTEWLQKSLNFVLDHAAVTSIIMGTISPEHLRQNLILIEQILARQSLD